MTRLDYIRKIRGMSAGVAVDDILRKVKVKYWTKRDHVRVKLGGRSASLHIRKYTTDAEVVWQCFAAGQYEVPKINGVTPVHFDAIERRYLSIVQSGKIPLIIDCGANMGASTTWFNLRYPHSKIVAIEPAVGNFDVLKTNCGVIENVDLLHAAVGGKDGQIYLKDNGGGDWGFQTTESNTGVLVNMLSLRGLVSRYRDRGFVPFILKIDIEGAEKDLFDEPTHEIGSFPLIILEPHDFYMPTARTASPFFKFHAEAGRDFMFAVENVFSMDMVALSDI